MATTNKHRTRISRYYIDTRPLVPEKPKQPYSLPLLEQLTQSDQEAVTRFLRPADKFMSLASALLKYTFIHRQAKIPWSKVVISRTPAPHRRPYWAPPSDWDDDGANADGTGTGKGGLEFNVTHQAGVVAIIGCTTPTAQLPTVPAPTSPLQSTPLSAKLHNLHLDLTGHDTTSDLDHYPPHQVHVRLGVDIACADEDKRTPKDMTTQAKFDEWVDIFGEMFSERERWNMRHAVVHVPVVERDEGVWPSSDESSASEGLGGNGEAARLRRARENEARITQLKLRRFYAYWALKEAYIKMVGEGLLADWLKELEFLDVVAPVPPSSVMGRHRKSGSRSRSRGTSHHRAPSHSHSHSHSHHGHGHHHSLSTGLGIDPAAEEAAKWTDPAKAEKGMVTSLRGRKLDDVDIELVAYDEDFLIATATRGVIEVFNDDEDDEKENGVQQEIVENGVIDAQRQAPLGRAQQRKRWIMLDIERDIRPCAEGRCRCLE
ncbi:hypothetical protein LTR84_003824 [Exophiala bonariae]|uniref:holo-[acyl-carrier-protein] synthase n=1 Tax=Exophiala bonariae TaxID=1690606 RepID=A0AAV9N6J8_9EURO|nr:hypothetical protein LTR84_003824 [Exophiala bonariae]